MLRHQLGMAVDQPLIQIKEDKMDQIKSNSEVTLTDLRRLGLQGDATARLVSGEEVKLTSKHGLIPKKGYVAGRCADEPSCRSKISQGNPWYRYNNKKTAAKGK